MKVALISGGLGDIGSAIAILFGKQGIKVAIGDVMEEAEAEAGLAGLREKGCRELLYTKVDVTDEHAVTVWLNAVEKKWGIAQIVVPNAGIVVAGSFTSDGFSTGQLRRQMDVNFWGSYYLAVQAAKRMKDQKLPGRIVFMGSWVADRPLVRISSYCISKAAVRMLCKTLALDLADAGILVNEVAPGIVEGGLSKKNQKKDPGLLQIHLDSTPVHRLISADEIAQHVLHLSSFSSLSMTGSTLVVDGGLSLTSRMTP